MPKSPPRSHFRIRHRGTPHRLALGLALLAALVCAGWRAGGFDFADRAVAAARTRALGPAAAGRGAAAAMPADATVAGGAGAGRSALTPAGPDSPATLLAAAGIALEPVSEREGPQARLRVRGLRIIRGVQPPRLVLNPEAPRVLSRKLAHLNALPALLRARSGIVPSRGTSRPPPSRLLS